MIQAKSSMTVAIVFMLIYSLSFAGIWACVRELSSDMSPLLLAFFRTSIGMLFMLPILFKVKLSSINRKRLPLYFLRSALNIVSVFGAFYAVSQIPLADAVALSYAAPIFATILAVFFLKERIHLPRIIAIFVAFLGVLIVLRPGFQVINSGMISALFAAFGFAATLVCVKILTRDDSPSLVSLMGFALAVPLSFVIALPFWQWPTPDQWQLIILLGALAGVAHFALTKAISMAELSSVMPIDFTRIIFAASFGIFFFDDPLDGLTFLGGAIIMGSTVYSAHRERRKSAESSRS